MKRRRILPVFVAILLCGVLPSSHTNALELGDVDRPPLLEAAAAGDTKTLIQLLDQGTSIGQTDANGKTALITAAELGQVEVVRALLSRGAAVTTRDKFGASALSRATRYPAIVQLLIEANAPVDERDNDFRSPLIVAAMEGLLPTVRMLVERGANPNKRDSSRRNAYEAALANGRKEVAEYLKSRIRIEVSIVQAAFAGDTSALERLLADRTDPNAAELNGMTALHMAAWTAHPKIVRLLLSAGADPNRSDLFGYTPVYYSFYLWKPENNMEPNPEALAILEMLSEKGASLRRMGNSGVTPLSLASGLDMPTVVSFLLGRKVDVNESSITGNTALLNARSVAVARLLVNAGARANVVNIYGQTVLSGCEDAELARFYLSLGADINKRDVNGETPLMTTSSGDVARVLIASGSDVNARNNVGETVLMNAVGHDRVDVMRALLEQRVNPNFQDPKYGDYALKHAKSESAALVLLDAGANPNLVDKWNRNALHGQSNPAIVRALIKRGVDLNRQDTSNDTALIRASASGRLEVVRELIQAKVNLNLTNKRGQTALFVAKDPAIVSLLMKAGIEFRIRNNENLSALFAFDRADMQTAVIANIRNLDDELEGDLPYLHTACKRKRIDLVRLLLDSGASIRKLDTYNRTAVFFAGDDAILELLLSRGADANALNGDGETVLFQEFTRERLNLLRKYGIRLNQQNRQGVSAIMHALANQRTEQFRMLAEAGADVNQRDKNGRNALYFVNNLSEAEILAARGIRIHVENDLGITALNALACDGGKPEIARAMLKRSQNVNTLLAEGNTELTRAAQTGCPALVVMLLEAHANPLIRNAEGYTAFEIAERNYLNVMDEYKNNRETVERKNHFEQIYVQLKKASSP